MDGRDEYDRLAWGLVREEIRNLQRGRGDKDAETLLVKKMINGQTNPFRRGFLGAAEINEFRDQLLSSLRDEVGLFALDHYRYRIDPGSAMTQLTDGMFWEIKDIELTHDDRDNHGEKMATLHGLTMTIGKKGLVCDMSSSSVTFNQHSMYRMIQRGLIDREPLAYLTRTLDEWLPYAGVMLLAHRADNEYLGGQTIIPMGNGAMLAHLRVMSMVELDKALKGEQGSLRGFRTHVTGPGPFMSSLPYKSFVEGGTSNGSAAYLILGMSTWIPEAFFHSQQWWVVMRLKELREKYPHQFKAAALMLHSHAANALLSESESPQETAAFKEELELLMANPKWAIACNWSKHGTA